MGKVVLVSVLLAALFLASPTTASDEATLTPSITRGRVEFLPPLVPEQGESCSITLKNWGTPRQIVLQNRALDGMRALFDGDLGTFRYYVEQNGLPKSLQLILPIFHGIGALRTSHGGTPMRWSRAFSYVRDSTRKAVAKELKKQRRTPFPVASETFDWPMSGNFVGSGETHSYEQRWGSGAATIQTLTGHFARLRDKYKIRRLVPIGASAAPTILGDHRIQSQIDGLIFLGPVIPGIAAGFDQSVGNFHRLAAEGKIFTPNWPAFDWWYKAVQGASWADDPQPFRVPTLILVGENDPEVPLQTREWLQNQARINPLVEMYIIPNARHDVLTSYPLLDANGQRIGMYDPTASYILINNFLESHFGTQLSVPPQ
jgi:hypothetical protein